MNLLALMLLLAPAQAQEEACAGVLRLQTWEEALDAVDAAIADFNGERATRILDDVHHELRCLGDPATPELLGRMARQLSLMAFYEQDAAETEAWGQLARETIGGAPWPDGLPVPPAYHAYVAELAEPTVRTVEEKGLAVPKKGAVLLDGWLLTVPEATLGTTHLVQVADKKGAVLSTAWQHGATFPDAVLGPPASVSAPRWYTAPPDPPPMPEPPALDEGDDAVAVVDEVVEEPEVDEVVEEPVVDEVVVEPVVDEVVEEPVVDEVVEEPVVDEVAPDQAVRGRRTLAVDAEERKKMFETKDAQDGCPWRKEPKKASATGGSVSINKHTYSVKSAAEQREFREVLRSCGEFRAARRFTRWRQAKKKLAFDARTYRDRMVKALITEEPVRKKRKK